jgi:hypothetical protein
LLNKFLIRRGKKRPFWSDDTGARSNPAKTIVHSVSAVGPGPLVQWFCDVEGNTDQGAFEFGQFEFVGSPDPGGVVLLNPLFISPK